MEFDEVQRSMEFLLAQQAQFAADLQQSRELLHQSRELSDQRHAEISRALIGAMAFGGILAESDPMLPDVDGDVLSIRDDYRGMKLPVLMSDWLKLRKESLKLLKHVKSAQWERRVKGGDMEAYYRDAAKSVPLPEEQITTAKDELAQAEAGS